MRLAVGTAGISSRPGCHGQLACPCGRGDAQVPSRSALAGKQPVARYRWLHYLLRMFLAVGLAGCAGYRFGAGTLYPPDIHTVYVPVFESDSFRRGLGERLTEAVVKEIELKTPYKVVSSAEADSVLTGKILLDTKRVLVEDPNDQPRETQVSMTIKVAWIDRKGDLVGATTSGKIPIPDDALSLTTMGELIPEYGQSTVTAQQAAINTLAEKIVQMMEAPW